MGEKFKITCDLSAPIEHCFEAAYVDEKMMGWVPNPKSVVYDHTQALEPYGVGSTRLITLKSGQALTEKIVLTERPNKIIYGIDTFGKVMDAMVRDYQGHMDFEAIDTNNTRMTWSVHYNCHGVGKVMAPLLKQAYKLLIKTMVKNMKNYHLKKGASIDH